VRVNGAMAESSAFSKVATIPTALLKGCSLTSRHSLDDRAIH